MSGTYGPFAVASKFQDSVMRDRDETTDIRIIEELVARSRVDLVTSVTELNRWVTFSVAISTGSKLMNTSRWREVLERTVDRLRGIKHISETLMFSNALSAKIQQV